MLISGATGVGKSYVACALGHMACRQGLKVLDRRVPRPFDELALAKGRRQLRADLGEDRQARLTYIWAKYRCAASLAANVIPNAVYVRGKYLRFPNWPWWVSEWYERRGEICDFVDWPSDPNAQALRETEALTHK